jgi:hypothetical protein
MSEITILCTAHKERGLCNKNELFNILEIIEPDVIFEELSESLYEKCYVTNTAHFLETDTIRLYRGKHNFQHIPIDSENHNEKELYQFYLDCNEVFSTIISNSSEYSVLKEKNEILTQKYGFHYLNSRLCDSINSNINNIELDILRHLNNPTLLSTYNNWLELNKKREVAMINRVYDYCKLHKDLIGVFFIGAGHRISIKETIEKRNSDINNTINWIFTDYNVEECT